MTNNAVPNQTLPHLALRAIDVVVGDIDRTLAFYSGIAPLLELRRFSLPADRFGPELLDNPVGEIHLAVVAGPTGILNLLQFPNAPARGTEMPVPGPGYTHICFQSRASDPALAKFMARGLGLISRCDENGVDLGGYGVRYSYGRDPEARMIEVEILDYPRRDETAWVAHIANCAHDHALLHGFYQRLLEREPRRVLPVSSRPTFDMVADLDGVSLQASWFQVRNLEIELWGYHNPPTPAPPGQRKLDTIGYGGFALEVSDLAVEVARLGSLGIPLIGPEIDFGGWQTQYAADPEGNLFSVQQRTSAPVEESGLAFDPI